MEKKLAEVIMNPVRQRIAQYLLLHETGTVNEISAALNDVPKPSLYRHMNVLRNAGCIEVVSEKVVRGAVERTYRIVAQPVENPSQEQIASLIQGILGSTVAAFSNYFAQNDANPQRDMLSVSSSVLMMSDTEMMEFLQLIGDVMGKYINNAPKADRKPRNIMFISCPVAMKGEGKHAEN